MPVYDDQKHEYDSPLDSEEPKKSEKDKSSLDSSELENAENSVGQQQAAAPDEQEQSAVSKHESQLGRGYTGGDEGSSRFSKFSLKNWTKKKTATATIIAILGGGGIFGFSILQGPFQLVHLSQILQLNYSKGESDSGARLARMFRYAKSGDPASLRMSRLSLRSFNKSVARMEKVGITINRTDSVGNPMSLEIDTSKPDSPYHGMNKEQAIKAIAKDFDMPESKVGQISVDYKGRPKIAVSLAGESSKNLRRVRGVAQLMVGDKGIMGFFRGRAIDKALSIGRHPMSKLSKKYGEMKEIKTRQKIEKERQKKVRSATREKVTNYKGALADKLNTKGGKAALGVLTGTAVLCMVKDVAEIVPTYNAAVRKDSIVAASDLISVGSQVQDGDGLDMAAAGSIVQSFKDDKGQTIWSAKALQAASGKQKPQGEDIDPDMKSAFAGTSNWSKVNAFLDEYHADEVCSTIGQSIAAGLGLLAVAFGPGGIMFNAVKAGGSAAAGAVVMSIITKTVEPDFITPEVISGAVGGNFIAYGAREASNASARATGGVDLGSAESAMIDKQIAEQSKKEFTEQPFFARMFNVYDHRSFASTVIDNVNLRPGSVAKFASKMPSILNFGSIGRPIFASSVSAESSNYDWGFNRYGLRQSVLDDEKYANPFENGATAIKAIENDFGLADRVKNCFGAELNDDHSGFKFPSSEEDTVDQYGPDYLRSNCDDTGETWSRISVAIFDDHLAMSRACYEADDSNPDDAEGTEACNELGVENGSTPGQDTDDANNDSGLVSGNDKELAKKIIDSSKFGGDPRYVEQIKAYASGDDTCYVNPTILQLLATILDKGYSIYVSSLNRLCTGVITASGEASYHYAEKGGHAVDISMINGVATTGRDDNARKLLETIVKDLPKGSGIGQIQCGQGVQLPPGISEFNDSCNHLHIQVPKR